MEYKKIILTIFFVIFIDQLTKIYFLCNFELNKYYKIPYIYNFVSIYLTLNEGLAFGLFTNFKFERILFFILRIILLIYIYQYFKKNSTINSNKKLIYGTGLILGGGISNTIDWLLYGIFFNILQNNAPMKLFYGQVVDIFFLPFLNISYVFNFADICIFLGIIFCIPFKKNKEKTFNNIINN